MLNKLMIGPFGGEIKNAIAQWKEKSGKYILRNEPHLEDNLEKTFSAIYSFKSVIELIDTTIADLLNKNIYSSSINNEFSAPNGSKINIKMEMALPKKHKRFIDKWNLLNDVHLSSSMIKDMNIQFSDIVKLRYANYMGFIHSIIDFDYIIYETEE